MPVLERTMKTMRLSDDVVTFSTFRKTMAECFNRNTQTGRPLLITQNGVASKVVIDVSDFDNIRETLELVDDIMSAESELDAGLGIPHDKLKQQLKTESELLRKELGL
ncbi:MAG: type II toxin-antitoxin system prevent-host-death family antitoxin [Kiritimatiellae bacterium]|nr:type II toxin-antitoxin system prevent-host-death family antitoxin [Kiritimatiellia bacterium]MBR3822299.1 type II toxin-antitoxin system prevent-host-death family antitoxin [Kiritimatiellia bacterium]MBR3924189.1 type II toxin-antitoxin system prevent-host-death family antitoxin [Kiritimatiellia bacterium]